ncbi:MAG: HEAT repeat domain-containing protein, partial [Candidatus Eremiobacterota bacterium]
DHAIQALGTLRKLGAGPCAEPIAACLERPDLRFAAAEILLELDRERWLRTVLRAGGGSVVPLARAQPRDYEKPLSGFLTDPDPTVAGEAALGLDATGRAAPYRAGLAALLESSRGETARAATDALLKLPPRPRYPEVVAYLSSPNADARLRAYRLLGRLGALGDAEEVARGLQGPDRAWAVESLGMMAAREHAGRVAGCLDQRGCRREALRALRQMGDLGQREAVAACLDDPDVRVRSEAALALAWLGDRRAVPGLLAIVNRKFPDAWTFDNELLVALNGLRQPARFQRLAGLRLHSTLIAPRVSDVLKVIVSKSGLRLEDPQSVTGRSGYSFIAPGTLAQLLDEMRFWNDGAFILEDDRLRVVSREEAWRLGKEWLQHP